MLSRTIRRPLQRIAYQRTACSVCTCRCGTAFQPKAFSTTPAIHARGRGSPSTRRRENNKGSVVVSPKEAREYREELELIMETNNKERYAKISEAHDKGQFGMTAEEVDEFLAAFADICKDKKLRVGAKAPEAFRMLVDALGLEERDLMFLAMMLVQNKHVEDDRYWGRRLLDTLSAAGFVEATIRLVNNALVQAKKMPGVMRNAAIAVERGRLQKFARQENHSRAMVLEGKVTYFLGDKDAAIKWWWQAMDDAVTRGEDMLAKRAAGEKMGFDVSAVDRSELSTPWIELIEAHFDRSLNEGKNEWEQVEKAIKIGLEQDDPTAFYYAATYYKDKQKTGPNAGQHIPTSKWLYYMSKAAASGVPKAAHELGVYYRDSGWKYIEDEPPEHLKPTPFDTYPAAEAADTSFLGKVRQFFAPLNDSETEISESENIFHTAAWPPNPEQRHDLAIIWLTVAVKYMYVPAMLDLAKLCMEETLWAGAQAPPEALALDPKRYLYASEGDFHDAQFVDDVKSYEVPEDAKDPPSPSYNHNKAKILLREVFRSRVSVVWRARLMSIWQSSSRYETKDWDDLVMNEQSKQEVSDLAKFWDNADVYDTWEKQSLALYKEAAEICDHMQWEIRDDEGRGLMYAPAMPSNLRDIYENTK